MEEDDDMGLIRRRPGLLAVVLWAIVTSASVSIGIAYLQHFVSLPGLDAQPSEVAAPDFTAIPVEAARRLADAHGLTLEVGESRESEDVAEGDIIEQSPGVGEGVAPGGSVTVHASSGPPLVEVPDVRRRTVADARVAFELVGLVAGAVTETEGPGDPGTVTATEPAPGARVARGATIAITANPETPPGIAVPDLTNLRLGEARRLLQEAGLEAGRVRRRWDDRRGPDVVLSQEPAAGERVEAGTAIEITANEGV